MQAWNSYYEMIGGAAATLLGLLFVSVSVNAGRILGAGHQHSKRLAEQAFQNYLVVLAISLVGLFPDMSEASFGDVIIAMTVAWGAWILVRIYLALASKSLREARIRTFRRYLASLIGFGMLVYSGVWMTLGATQFRNSIAIALMLLLLSATTVSWELLVSIAGEQQSPSGK
jgi:hypothetical protein